MTPEEIIAMAKETIGDYSANDYWPFFTEELQKFAAQVAAKERDACADIVENADTPDCGGWTAQGIADAIRARGTKEGA